MDLILREGFRLLGIYFITIGILLVIMFYIFKYIKQLREEHKEEREAWRKTIENQFEIMNENQKENYALLNSIKSILESRR